MRLNRGTLILVGVLALVIVGALLLNNQQASAPGEPTPTAMPVGGPLFAAIETRTGTIVRIQVQDNLTGRTVAYDKDSDGLWQLATGGQPDQPPVIQAVEDFAELDANDTFEGDALADFGLDAPTHSVYVSDGETVYVLHIGGTNFNGARYYVTTAELTPADLPEIAAADMTPEATPDAEATPEAEATAEAAPESTAESTPEAADPLVTLSGMQRISTIPRAAAEDFIALLDPVMPAEVTPEPTLVLESLVTPEATAEATAEATPDAETTPEAEATAETTDAP
jgi:hypothetical protein